MRPAFRCAFVGAVVMASACRSQMAITSGKTLCIIDGKTYNAEEIEPNVRAKCCRPDLDQYQWTPWFQPPANYRTVLGPNFLAAVDLQQNGLADLIVVSAAALAIHRQLGGDAGFMDLGDEFAFGNVVLATGTAPDAGDLNGDGYPDVIVLSTGPCRIDGHCMGVTVLLGNPSTHDFTAPVHYLDGESVVSGALADFDRDGLLDLAVAQPGLGDGGGWVRILWNKGGGALEADPLVYFPVGAAPSAMAVGDLNGDGWPDLVVANATDHDISVLFNQHSRADGGFVAWGQLVCGGTPWSVAVADFRGAGSPDVAVANGDGYVTFWLNDAGGTFANPEVTTVGGSPYALATADFDRDGNTDLVVAGFEGTISLLRPSLKGVPAIKLTTGFNSTTSIVAADFNNDGRVDLAATDQHNNSLQVFMANCGGP